jgi:hypothetical protein
VSNGILLTFSRYVHANYRFIVNPKGDYHAQAVDADVHLDWSMVLQIWHLLRHNPPAVRYAYQNPWHQEWQSAAISSVCHVSFATCIRQTIPSPSPRKKARWKKCPICWDSVYVSETRPVRWFTGQEGKNLEKVVMWFSGSSCGNREAPSRYLEMALMRLQDRRRPMVFRC